MLAEAAAIALCGMALGLCVLYRARTGEPWAKWLVAFLSVVLASILIQTIDRYTGFRLELLGMERFAFVLNLVFGSAAGLCFAFLVLFLPFFTSLLLCRSHFGKGYWVLLSLLAAVHLAAGVLGVLFERIWLAAIRQTVFFGVFVFCMASLWANVSKVEDRATRRMIVAANIVCLSLIPVFALSVFFPESASASYALYSIAFSILMIVYFYGYFAEDFKESRRESRELRLEDLASYRISEREFSVILLVSNGLTNKEIASELGISVNTVNNHVANIFSKTGVRSRVDLVNLLKEVVK